MTTVTPQLLPPEDDTTTYTSREPLRISRVLTDSNYAALLDNMDVSAFLVVREGELRLTPPEALKSGTHQLVLFKSGATGSTKAGEWSFQVNGSTDISFQTSGSLNISARLGQSDSMNDTSRWQADGAWNIMAEIQENDWAAQARADLFVQTNNSLFDGGSSEQKTVDLGEYLLTLRKGNLGAKIGHHQTGPQSLIMRGFNRRGASMSWSDKNRRLSGTGFVYHTVPLTGFDRFLEFNYSEEQVTGIVATSRPFSFGNTEMSATWLTGKSVNQSGSSGSLGTTPSSGDAWSLAMASQPFTDKLMLRGEYAQTSFLSDDDAPQSQAVDDTAWTLTTVWTPIQSSDPEDSFTTFQTGIEQLHVGPAFRSLANLGQPRDVDSSRIFTTVGLRETFLNAQVERQTNNTDNNPLLPTIRTDLINMSLNYAPIPDLKNIPWYGNPVLSLSYTRAAQDVEDTPVSNPLSLDLMSQQHTASTSFRYEIWDWLASYSQGEQEDRTQQQPDSRNQLVSLGINGHLDNWFFGSGTVQFNETQDLSSDNSTNELLLTLSSTLLLFQDVLSSTLNFTYSDMNDNQGSMDTSSSTLDLGLNWMALAPKPNALGLTLWLKGQYQTITSNTTAPDSIENYQIFTGATISYER